MAALRRARRRGVNVDVLVTRRAKGGRRALESLVSEMQSAGFGVRRYAGPSAKYHAKYVVADGRTALIGSFNFTHRCFERTCDFAVLTSARDVLLGLTRLFEADFHGVTGYTGADFGYRLVVGPDAARAWFSSVLGAARHSIRVVDHKLCDPGMLSAIRTRAAAGVTVATLGRNDLDDLAPHGKLAIVDAAVAVIGSIALSTKHLDRRRELAIVLRQPALVAELIDYFDSLAEGRPRRGFARGGLEPRLSCESV
jgi:phosphatidylserine/phosphatidylglycerophosphate/cardiolipin synthase-like enzyme